MINSFSASSLKLLQKNIEEFKAKYEFLLYFSYGNKNTQEGSKFHKLIYYYLRGFDITKLIATLNLTEKEIWEKFLRSGLLNKKFEMFEQSFLIKCKKCDVFFFLNGRFDAVTKEDNFYTIFDWKMENIPKNPKNDIQTVVYLYCASKLFKTNKLKVKYVSIKNLKSEEVVFENIEEYENIIFGIVKKYLKDIC